MMEDVKAQFAANISTARDAGVSGVPALVACGQHQLRGQDRLDLVARAPAGWAILSTAQ